MHHRLFLISTLLVIIMLLGMTTVIVLVNNREITAAPAGESAEDRIARIGAVILRTKLQRLQNMGTALKLKQEGEALLRSMIQE